ncbi:hypothetical protein Sango_0367900 [Sesamum angolense]|uniref:Uncharacterized protein n=1 Tax=Sesamum angolense TaxID=2727404 RepID=A0AAE2C3M9_9LAMI|nr:hypothetical protein Sango_0367900 [Sesamum angolense]
MSRSAKHSLQFFKALRKTNTFIWNEEYQQPGSAIKAQALAEFINEAMLVEEDEEHWLLHANGFYTLAGSGAEVVLTNPKRDELEYALRFNFKTSNNKAEYEAFIVGVFMEGKRVARKGLKCEKRKCFCSSNAKKTRDPRVIRNPQDRDWLHFYPCPRVIKRAVDFEKLGRKGTKKGKKRKVQTFYNGVTLANRNIIDIVAGGTIMKKLPSEAVSIIDEIATNLYSYGQERTDTSTTSIHNIEAISALSAQVAALMHTVNNSLQMGATMWNGAPIGPCGACGQMGYLSQSCKVGSQFSIQEDANFVSHDDRTTEISSTTIASPTREERQSRKFALQIHNSSRRPIPKSRCIDSKFGSASGTIDAEQCQVLEGDMEEDKNMPLILGRPFLATSRTLIDVQKGQLTLRINDEHIVFNVFKPVKYLCKNEHDIFAIDSINATRIDNVHLVKCENPKVDCIENSNGDNLQSMKEKLEDVPSFIDIGQEVKSKLQKVLLLNGSTSNQKVQPPFEASFDRKKTCEDKWGRPNRMKRWRNQVDENVGFYKDHTKAWNDFHMRKKKIKDGDKRHHKNKGPIKVDWQTLKHYIKGEPPRVEPWCRLSTNWVSERRANDVKQALRGRQPMNILVKGVTFQSSELLITRGSRHI